MHHGHCSAKFFILLTPQITFCHSYLSLSQRALAQYFDSSLVFDPYHCMFEGNLTRASNCWEKLQSTDLPLILMEGKYTLSHFSSSFNISNAFSKTVRFRPNRNHYEFLSLFKTCRFRISVKVVNLHKY